MPRASTAISSTAKRLALAAVAGAVLMAMTAAGPTTAHAQTPTLGTYAATTIGLGGNATVTPSAAPTGSTSLSVSAPTGFIGTLTADPATGVVRVTNAQLARIPAGAYPVTVRAFGPGGTTTTTFGLTVTPMACTGTAVFSGAGSVGVGDTPSNLALGDFNGDGKQDFAAANKLAGTVSIQLGDGSGGFVGTTEVAVGARPSSVAVGDFNGDGRQDIAVANAWAYSVSIRLGDGSGGFGGTTEVSVGQEPRCVVIGDFNGDGKQDLATADAYVNTVSIRLGDGLGGFGGTGSVSGGFYPNALAVGDFDGDGNQDLVVAVTGGRSLLVYWGNGLGGFTGPSWLDVGSNPIGVVVGDFNGDGNQDIAASNSATDPTLIYPNTVSIRLGDGAGGFSGTTNVGVGTYPYRLAVGDFDGDGNQDIAVGNFGSNSVSILTGDGAGGFAVTSDLGVGRAPTGVAIGDFDGDGSQDLAVLCAGGDNLVSVHLGACTPSPLDPAYVEAVLASGPVLYWSFEESGLDPAQERITQLASNALVPQQGAKRAAGLSGLGAAASFSGSRSFEQTQPRFHAGALSVGGPTVFDHYAIEMWVKLDDASGIQYLLEASDGGQYNAPALIHGFVSNAGLPALEYFSSAGRTGETGPTRLDDNQWHHLVVEADVAAATHTIYVDGAQALQTSAASPWRLPILGVGATAYWDGFHGADGMIDELAFYDLSSGPATGASIAAHYYVMFPNTTAVPGAPVPSSRPVLHASVPNPFNPSTTIRFDLPQAGEVELTIYDMAGRRVRTLVRESLGAGSHEVVWRGEDQNGRPVQSGVYLYRLRAGADVETRRMTLLK